MEYITLKDIAIINMGQSPDSKTYNEEKEGIPFYQGKSDFGKINPIPRVWCSNPIKIAEKEDILISVRAPIGDTNIATEKCCIGRGLAAIRPLNENINQKYLYYLLNSKYKELNKYGTGSTFKAITKDNLYNLKCTQIPDIKEQTKVVKKLDNVSQIIEIKKEQLENLNTIIKSQFVEMFENENYDRKSLNDISIIKGEYGSGASAGEYIDGQPRYVRITDIQEDGRLNNDSMASPKNESNLEKYTLDYGDILFARTGATVGKTYKYSKEDGYCIYAGYCIRFRLNLEKVNPDYIFTFTKTEEYKKWVANKQRVVAQPNINAKEYGNDLLIPIPPIELQNQFADFVKQIDKQKFEIEKSLKEMQELYESLMEKYFG